MCVVDGVSNENMEWLSGGKRVHVKEQGRSRTSMRQGNQWISSWCYRNHNRFCL